MADRRRARSSSPFEDRYGFCRAVRVGDHIWVSGTAPIEADGSAGGDATAQAQRCFDVIEAALTELGGSLADVVRTRMFVSDPGVQDEVGGVHAVRVGHARPVATMVVAQLLDPAWFVEIEAEAVLARG